ncbi:MAG: integrin alpha [Planctomycetota bacterium]|nr:integrin alpha [Planctomycetota bacterium]
MLAIAIRLDSCLTLALDENARAGSFLDATGERVARYSDLAAWDATGRELATSMQPAPGGFVVEVDDEGARYPVTVDPLLTSVAWVQEGSDLEGRFGFSVASAGDVNSDGYDDVIIGAPNELHGSPVSGRVFVFHGSPTGLASSPAWSQSQSGSSGDFGYSVASAGDVNNDGFDDVIIGDPGLGKVWVYHGSSLGLGAIEAWSRQTGGTYGFSVASAGDINNDGFDDIIIGDPKRNAPSFNEGQVTVHHGSATGLSLLPEWTVDGTSAFQQSGWSVASAGDVNHDGYSDVIFGVPNYTNGEPDEGAARVYHGSAMGLGATVAWTMESDQAFANFGTSVASAGDVNGDFHSDVIVGAPGPNSFSGSAFVYHGSPLGLGPVEAWSTNSAQVLAYFGSSVASAGDVDGDNYSDVIVGAYGAGGVGKFRGGAFVYEGSVGGLSTLPVWEVAATQNGASLGRSVASAGDVDGDSISDVILGADLYDGALVDVGQAMVFHGSGSPTNPALGSITNGSGINPMCFTSQPPVLGQPWVSTIDTSVDASALASSIAVYATSSSGIFLPSGELLVDLSSPLLFLASAPVLGPTTTYTAPIPALTALVGLQATAQGLVIGTNWTLCNAYTMTFGY